MVSDQLEKLLAQKPMKKPAKAWRNWYKVLQRVRYKDTGNTYSAGDIYAGKHPWPSKEVAEQKASDFMAADLFKHGHHFEEYLGAFPEGERP